jgi:hypothetical protein
MFVKCILYRVSRCHRCLLQNDTKATFTKWQTLPLEETRLCKRSLAALARRKSTGKKNEVGVNRLTAQTKQPQHHFLPSASTACIPSHMLRTCDIWAFGDGRDMPGSMGDHGRRSENAPSPVRLSSPRRVPSPPLPPAAGRKDESIG